MLLFVEWLEGDQLAPSVPVDVEIPNRREEQGDRRARTGAGAAVSSMPPGRGLRHRPLCASTTARSDSPTAVDPCLPLDETPGATPSGSRTLQFVFAFDAVDLVDDALENPHLTSGTADQEVEIV